MTHSTLALGKSGGQAHGVGPLPHCTGVLWFPVTVLRCESRAPRHSVQVSVGCRGRRAWVSWDHRLQGPARQSLRHSIMEGMWWAQSWARPRGSESVEFCWEGPEVHSSGPAVCWGGSAICSDGAEEGQSHGDGAARAWPAWQGSAEQGWGGGGAWPNTSARVTGQLPGKRLGVHTLSNFLWLYTLFLFINVSKIQSHRKEPWAETHM